MDRRLRNVFGKLVQNSLVAKFVQGCDRFDGGCEFPSIKVSETCLVSRTTPLDLIVIHVKL